MKRTLLLFLSSCIFPLLKAQEFNTESITVFKNGISFFYKTTQIDASSGQVKLRALPINEPTKSENPVYNRIGATIPVLFGSVWFSSPQNPINRTAVFTESITKEEKTTSLNDILLNNLDKTVRFRLKEETTIFSGTVFSLENNILLVQMDKGWRQFPVGYVEYFDFEERPNLSKTTTTQQKVVQLDFEQKKKNTPVELMYMQRGISWMPNYQLQLLGENKAKLSLRANLINDIEDLEEVSINFVVGIPSFSFSYVQEPLFSGQSLVEFLTYLGRTPDDNRSYNYSNTITTQRATLNFARPTNGYEGIESDEGSLSKEDLFFYKKEKINLPKGGRMAIDLLETTFDYEDVYSVELSKGFSGINKDDNFRNKVWHSLKFKNASGYPLTTGPISFIRNDKGSKSPISQNQLDFVPVGQLAKVKMSQVPDISVLDQEKEIDRQDFARDRWDLVTVEATIEVSNFKNQEVSLEIEREIEGELLKSDLPWESYSIVKNLNARNPVNYASWNFKLKAGEKKKITYSYKIYVN